MVYTSSGVKYALWSTNRVTCLTFIHPDRWMHKHPQQNECINAAAPTMVDYHVYCRAVTDPCKCQSQLQYRLNRLNCMYFRQIRTEHFYAVINMCSTLKFITASHRDDPIILICAVVRSNTGHRTGACKSISLSHKALRGSRGEHNALSSCAG